VTHGHWPELPYAAWRDTRDTLHLYLQVIGKVRLALAPMEPQWGQVPLYVTARGLNTSPIPHTAGAFDIDVDLVDHVVSVRTAAGDLRRVRLEPRTVADFYGELMAALEGAGVATTITRMPQEVPDPIPFSEDRTHTSYEPEWANRFWRVLVSVDAVFKEHRAQFHGKSSPVQLYWGALDLSYMLFSGRPAEPPAGAGVIGRYSADAEHFCAGFWPGDSRLAEPAFFAYASPAAPGIEEAEIGPAAAGWGAELGEFVLLYDAVRSAPDPRAAILEFLETTHRAAARLTEWDPRLTRAAGVD